MNPLLDPDIQSFIQTHEGEDVRALGLKKPPQPDWPYALILDQIKARQKAQVKLPGWLARSDIIFPGSDILEQASSVATARYKAGLVQAKSFADLTGGAGVDGWALAERYDSGTVVERDVPAAALLAHNLPLLTNKPVGIVRGAAEAFVKTMEPVDLAYIDPQRRTSSRKGLYRLEDCSPDVTALLADLRGKARHVMIKTSPMLDIEQALGALERVTAVHIVQWRGECKEVLYLIDFEQEAPEVSFTAANIDDEGQLLQSFSFTKAEETASEAPLSQPQSYIYEPGPAFLKAGGFNALAARYGLSKLHKHTHLYTSMQPAADFPGRAFELVEILPVQRKALTLAKANLAVRNFPSDVEKLKKKLGLKDGGEDYIFACTLSGEEKVLIHCRKAS